MSCGCERWWLSAEAADQRGQRHKEKRRRRRGGFSETEYGFDDSNCQLLFFFRGMYTTAIFICKIMRPDWWRIMLINKSIKYIIRIVSFMTFQTVYLGSSRGATLLNRHRRLVWDFSLSDSWNVSNSHQGGSCTHQASLTPVSDSCMDFFFWAAECFCVTPDAYRCTYLIYWSQSIVPVLLCLPRSTLVTSSLGVEETSVAHAVKSETTFY